MIIFPPGLSKWFIQVLQLLQLLKCENKARGLELPYEIRLPVEVYTRVRVARTSSPSRAFREPAHLSAFLFASFSNAYENNILCTISVIKTTTKQSKENKRVGNLQRVHHLGSFR